MRKFTTFLFLLGIYFGIVSIVKAVYGQVIPGYDLIAPIDGPSPAAGFVLGVVDITLNLWGLVLVQRWYRNR